MDTYRYVFAFMLSLSKHSWFILRRRYDL